MAAILYRGYDLISISRACNHNSSDAAQVDGLMQEICNSITNAPELHISYTNPSKWSPQV